MGEGFFGREEIGRLLGLPPACRVGAFFDGWTRKEAYLKGRAEGTGAGLDRFAVTLLPGEPARLISDERHPEETALWHLYNIPSGPSYSAAVAVRSSRMCMRHWTCRAIAPEVCMGIVQD